jgi:hypothetical protein
MNKDTVVIHDIHNASIRGPSKIFVVPRVNTSTKHIPQNLDWQEQDDSTTEASKRLSEELLGGVVPFTVHRMPTRGCDRRPTPTSPVKLEGEAVATRGGFKK